MQEKKEITAIFSCNDLMGIGAVNGCHRLGIKVPQDMSVMGFDNILLSNFIEPKLTTMDQNMMTLGWTAASLLMEKIANENPSLNTGNAASNVLKLSYHNFSALFTGDLPEKQEQELVQNRSDLQSTILKIAHHGSKTSSSAEFLQNVKPHFAVISVGKYNSFNHPSPEVIERLNKLQIPIYRTDTNGAIIFSTNGYKMKIDTFS